VNSFRSKGIVLRRVNFSETDRILTILTPDHGKIGAIAKGARKMNSKLGAHLEIFGEIDLMLVPAKSLHIVTSARLIAEFRGIGTEYEKMRKAYLFCEIVDKLVEKEASRELYNAFRDAMLSLQGSVNIYLAELYFKLRLLDLLGYRPDLRRCVESRSEILVGRRYVFSAARGGVMESVYATADINNNHIKLWRLCLAYSLEQVAKINGAERAAAQSLPIANEFYDYLFGKRFKSSEI
jgi:DNA repair protein RecO (recombination protein O)